MRLLASDALGLSGKRTDLEDAPVQKKASYASIELFFNVTLPYKNNKSYPSTAMV